jgi:hypothetical protein
VQLGWSTKGRTLAVIESRRLLDTGRLLPFVVALSGVTGTGLLVVSLLGDISINESIRLLECLAKMHF